MGIWCADSAEVGESKFEPRSRRLAIPHPGELVTDGVVGDDRAARASRESAMWGLGRDHHGHARGQVTLLTVDDDDE